MLICLFIFLLLLSFYICLLKDFLFCSLPSTPHFALCSGRSCRRRFCYFRVPRRDCALWLVRGKSGAPSRVFLPPTSKAKAPPPDNFYRRSIGSTGEHVSEDSLPGCCYEGAVSRESRIEGGASGGL